MTMIRHGDANVTAALLQLRQFGTVVIRILPSGATEARLCYDEVVLPPLKDGDVVRHAPEVEEAVENLRRAGYEEQGARQKDAADEVAAARAGR